MVTWRPLLAAILATSIVTATGCAARVRKQTVNLNPQQSKVYLQSANGPSAPHPSRPPGQSCHGIARSGDAIELVEDGGAVAVVEVTISTSSPSLRVANSVVVPVDSTTVLAGELPDGPLQEVTVASANRDDVLPPGRYMLLVGVTNQPGRYFLSDGIRGSFAVDGKSAYQRCVAIDSTTIQAVHSGTTDINQLAKVFEGAIQAVAKAPPFGVPTISSTHP